MGADRYQWDLVSDGDTTKADLAAERAKRIEAEAERDSHRATMKRLEELALSLEHNHRVEIRDIGREMRERMKGG